MNVKFHIEKLNFYFNKIQALKEINIDIQSNKILGVIGPASSGKTTFLRALNRMNDLEYGSEMDGIILLDDKNIYEPDYNVVELRRRVGMVFAMPVPLPMSIYENIVYGPKISGNNDRKHLEELTEKSLKAAYLWDEVKDRLKTSAMRLSGGQQQRLCLARVLAMEPDVILLDEPCSGLDPISTAKIEDALAELKKEYTIILVTNNTKQAARVSDNTAFFLMGELIEYGKTGQIFTAPSNPQTNEYITGRFG
ncbi:MAG: phosphate ABC transporter ATP-binding protein PstB [Ignavibacteria bacterium]